MIYFIGDVYIPKGLDSERFIRIFEPDDLIVANLECVIQVGELAREDKSSLLFTSIESIVDFTSRTGGNWIFSLANNHAHDGLQESLVYTIEVLMAHGYSVFGPTIGGSSDSIVIHDGLSEIRLVSGTTFHPEVMSICENDVFNEIYSTKLVNRLQSFDDDRIILIFHWGKEYMPLPSYDRRLISRSFIDLGVEGIISHHPHMIQGYEIIAEGFVCYSLGNFFFPEFYYRNQYLHEWTDTNNRSIAVCMDPNGGIDFIGFELKDLVLRKSLEALGEFQSRSDSLALNRKQYHIMFSQSELEVFKRRKSLRSIFRRYFPMHRDYGRLGVVINRIEREFSKFK